MKLTWAESCRRELAKLLLRSWGPVTACFATSPSAPRAAPGGSRRRARCPPGKRSAAAAPTRPRARATSLPRPSPRARRGLSRRRRARSLATTLTAPRRAKGFRKPEKRHGRRPRHWNPQTWGTLGDSARHGGTIGVHSPRPGRMHDTMCVTAQEVVPLRPLSLEPDGIGHGILPRHPQHSTQILVNAGRILVEASLHLIGLPKIRPHRPRAWSNRVRNWPNLIRIWSRQAQLWPTEAHLFAQASFWSSQAYF